MRKLGCIKTPAHRLAKVPFLADHLAISSLPLLADSVDYAQDMTEPWGMLANDQYGDCVFASLAHFKQAASVNATGKARKFTDSEVLRWYSEATGFDPDDPSTDNGANPIEALQYFMRIGEVVAYGRVDPTNDAHVAACIQLFGGLWSAWDLPEAWQNAETWDVGPNLRGQWAVGSWGGHAVNQVGHDAKCNTPTVTWGSVVPTTAAARHVYCSEAYALITQEWLDTRGKTIQGFDLEGLKARLKLVA